MADFKKSDLLYDDYSWTTSDNDDPTITGTPDKDLLNRTEGYEMLYFINSFMTSHDLKQKDSFQKIESMIRESLPGSIRSHKNIAKWIVENWKKN